ncbi:hypothetical protein GSI_06547 [Ganoderma sinense ZZ0214-1]|uniref:Uncharacterized protein n=1 Tax=Ganoderma sinense ZZ0214-1 TaxID=1077348 RepID=A0A2G8SDL5_9APHY|nr:hypothetical protein GSI_06547 [Ganoderma sinense ZZ0214-1]
MSPIVDVSESLGIHVFGARGCDLQVIAAYRGRSGGREARGQSEREASASVVCAMGGGAVVFTLYYGSVRQYTQFYGFKIVCIQKRMRADKSDISTTSSQERGVH